MRTPPAAERNGRIIVNRSSHRRRSTVGVEALVGLVGEMTSDDWVRVNGELWRARGAEAGERVRVRAVDGLTLEVERLERS